MAESESKNERDVGEGVKGGGAPEREGFSSKNAGKGVASGAGASESVGSSTAAKKAVEEIKRGISSDSKPDLDLLELTDIVGGEGSSQDKKPSGADEDREREEMEGESSDEETKSDVEESADKGLSDQEAVSAVDLEDIAQDKEDVLDKLDKEILPPEISSDDEDESKAVAEEDSDEGSEKSGVDERSKGIVTSQEKRDENAKAKREGPINLGGHQPHDTPVITDGGYAKEAAGGVITIPKGAGDRDMRGDTLSEANSGGERENVFKDEKGLEKEMELGQHRGVLDLDSAMSIKKSNNTSYGVSEYGDEVISDSVVNASQNILNDFMKAARRDPGPPITVEHIVTEAVKPYLADWLNKNLPSIVQKVVEKEIKKIIPNEE